ncbi:MAG: ExeM/NucH family extracellular endonuclease [Chloroflexi bacterium]|nr:ExeM/NucH family extracellular endonuclease [Chloroflexota bacterium]
MKFQRSLTSSRLFLMVAIAILLSGILPYTTQTVSASSSGVVISAIYTRGGSAGATYINKFVELFNAGSSPVNITGWTVRYAAPAATTWVTSGSNLATIPAVTLQPGQYYLIQGSSNGANGVALPTPDLVSTLNPGAAGGKFGLFTDAAACVTATAVGCASYVDFVGYGTANASETAVGLAQALTEILARKNNGCQDLDNNSIDFALQTASARNSATPLAPCAVMCTPSTFPYTMTTNTPAQLIAAIECANANGASADTINLNGQTVTLAVSYANYSGNTGLPEVTTPVTLQNGAITRSGTAFRLLRVNATGTLTLSDMTLSNGSMPVNAGGAVYSSGVLNVSRSTFANNSADNAGAIYIDGAGSTTSNIVNSTFSANIATNGAGADALYIFGTNIVNVYFSTFSGHDNSNTSSTVGIVHAGTDSTIDLTGSVIANNPLSVGGTARECTAGIGASLIGDSNLTADTICPGRIATPTNVSATLASNGGPTQTHALVTGSNAIDADASNYCTALTVTADQRGTARPQGPDCDLGAFEYAVVDPCAAITFPYTLPNNLAATLITAMECANANGASADTIDLNSQIVTLTASYADYTGATGLPQVTTNITLEGGVIIRSGGAPLFRLLNVGATGSLTLDGITASGGSLSSGDNAGAIFNDGGTLNILNSTITNNSAGFGGALYNSGPSATMMLVDSQFTNNSATQNGGLMMNDGGSVTLLRSAVSGNSSSGASGNGAIYNFEADLDILDSTFSGNSATTNVGAVQNFNGTTNIANSVFAGNSATNTSGAVLNNAAGVKTITNSTFSGNSAASTAGALLNNGSSVLTITNSTIAGNSATSAGGIYNAGTLTITNSIVWGNSSNALIGATITHSIIEGGFAGTGNLNVDPLFVAPVAFASAPTSSGNYRLQDNSPAVDAGSNTAVPVDSYDLNDNASTIDEAPDLDGNPRRYDDTGVADTGSGTAPIVDMGAYEKQTNTPAQNVDYCNLQFPTSFTLESGNSSPLIYGRIYEDDAGVLTADPGAHASIVGEVGYGPAGSDPTGNGSWLWFPSAFNVQIGNDDEYQGTFAAPAVASTTQFAYTTRFSVDGGANFTYCDSDGNGTNGGLSFNTASLGTMTVLPPGANYCALQFPSSFTVSGGQATPSIFGRVYEDDAGVLTNDPGAHASVVGQVGFGPLSSDPTNNLAWLWYPTTFNVQVGSDDEYQGTFQAPYVGSATQFSYTYRFSVDGGATYTPCDLDGNGTNAGLSLSTAQLGTMTVNPNGAAPISINDVTLAEGNAGTTNFVFTVSLGGVSADTITADIATADNTATLANSDYSFNSQNLSFAMGETSKTFTVLVNGDTAPEPNETFFVNLTNIVNAAPVDAQGMGTITNDDDVCTLYTFPYTMTGNTPAELVQAITCANANGTADIISLNDQIITLTDAVSSGLGLPAISSTITIQSGTITRASASNFRFFQVMPGQSLTLNRVTLTNGFGAGLTSDGGAIYNDGTLTLISSVLSGNHGMYGGAVFSSSTGTLSVTNSLISGNLADNTGGGIRNRGVLTVANSTIAGNYAASIGGGIANAGIFTLNLSNSVVYGNEAPTSPEIDGGVTSSSSSIVGVDPSFVSLLDASDNAPTTGGDYRLAHYSVAIDAGDNALVPGGITNDLPGFTRFYNDTGVTDTGLGAAPIVDMGAYEKQTNSPLVCGAAPDRIYELQDGGAKYGLAGPFTVDGVVTFDGQASGQWDGFYIQDPAGDGNSATSDGIYIYDPSPALLAVNAGDYVRVTGTVSEFAQNFSLVTPSGLSSTTETEITATAVTLCGNLAAVTPTVVTLPFATLNEQERYEGMLVTFNQTLSVTELFTLGRYNEISLSVGGRLFQPTNYLTPGAAAIAQQDLNNRSRILLDDGRKLQNVDPILYPAPALSASNTVRHGDTVASVTGVYTQANSRFGNGTSTNTNPFRYRLNPTAPVSFTPANPRPAAAPVVGGTLTAGSLNLLNYFNNFTACYLNGTFVNSNCRGANNATEFTRQRDKTIAAILEINPAVLGVNELENDVPNDNGGLNGATTAIEDLVNGLNAATAPGTYAFINTGRIGTDAIRVGMIYRPAVVTPVGAFAVLDNVDPFNRNTRPALAQTFASVATGGQFTMVANHFKSKGSCPLPADPNYTDPTYGENYDTGDGQGCWNADRERAAAALLTWLATNPTGTTDPDYLILGDLNSYAAEDPITFLTGSGYTNLIALYGGPGNVVYSYVFDGQSGYLDHALANSSMATQVTGAAEYHINADEPSVLDYNTEFKSAGQLVSLYAANEFRVSDHDPVIVGLNLTGMSADLTITKTDGVTSATPGGSVTYTITASNAGPDPVVGATVADTFPAILTGTWTCVGAGGGTCTAAGAGNISDTVNLPVGGSVTYTVSATISAAATGSLVNTATVSSAVTDPNPANNSATDSDTLTPQADLSITKTDGVTTEVPGGIVTYTITASNAGPSNSPVATVADTFPAILTGAWTCVGAGGGTCPAVGSGNISDIVNLPAGGSVTYTVSATISAAATGTLSNTATVTPAVTDPNPANNSATDVDTLTPQADLSITKTDGVTSATPGGSVTYTITASNAGPSNAPGATVADTFPAILTGTWTCVGAGGGTCTAAGAGNISDTVNLPAGGSVTYTVTATISAAATGTLSNTATVSSPSPTPTRPTTRPPIPIRWVDPPI